jgi:2-methylisocitrate lyase-like PEP mutase family enzyme
LLTVLRRLIDHHPEPVVAPLVFNPLTAKLAEAAGFRALYLGGGSMGYVKCVTEANLALPEMVQAGIDIKTVCTLPLILDGACGWGDPMHMHRTVRMSEAGGFAAIELEDQIMPKRAHHHIGLEHIVPAQEMVDKITEAVAARRSSEFLIIARTNAARTSNLDDALRRGEAYRKAGADMLFVLQKHQDDVRVIGERLGGPLMCMATGGGLLGIGMTASELSGLGYRLIVDPSTPLLAAHKALRQCYASMAQWLPDPLVGDTAKEEQDEIHAVIELEKMLEIERRTVERPRSEL